jgi:transcriptional regulator with XRE-family HTH domain
MPTLGQRIRERRQELQLTVRGFARDINVQPPFVTDIEAGRRRPSAETLAKIAEVLKLPIGELQALDPRISPEVKEWMESEPRVSTLLRQIRQSPDPDATLRQLEEQVREQADGDEDVRET